MSWQDDHADRIAGFPSEIKSAHDHSGNHRSEIEESKICGCFFCCVTFGSAEIQDWVDKNVEGIGQTALCPKCGIDSVIGDKSGFNLSKDFLSQMNEYWF